jgi:Mlc titration factor MtfA (ptsG expression regulator)
MALLFLIPLALAAWFVFQPRWLRHRRERLRARPFPVAWRAILRRRFPLYGRMPPPLRRQLEGHVLVFLAEKQFAGCEGQEITEEVRVIIAAQACMLLLNRNTGYFPRLRQVLVYPGPFVVERLRHEPSGVLQETRNALSGESWADGQVVLSWEDTLEGAADPGDGRNVVIHEFAHQLDQEKGYANGAPWLGSRTRYARWSSVLASEFARLQHAAMTGEPSLLSPYGATAPAEFFAVASEAFFEQPARMAAEHPALYGELARFYRVEPDKWGQSRLIN